MRSEFLFALLFVIIIPIAIAQNEQSHPLSQIKPIDTNLNMFGFNITNVTFIGINLTNPQYALDVVGDVRWSGSLRGGIVPWNLLSGYNLNVQWSGLLGWGNLTGYNLNVNWIGKLGWGNLTGYNLNVPWSGSLGWGNLTGYNLNVNWIGKLGWGNLTNYPSIITQIGSGLNASTKSLANNVILGVNFTEVQKRVTGSCSGSNAIQVINADGSVVCVDINLYGNVTGTGTSGYIPLWQTSSSLNNSLINQTNGNIWITSGNLNIVSGALQIGGTNVITSGRSIINVYDVNASRFFQNGVQVIDTINANAPLTSSKIGGSVTIALTTPLALNYGGTGADLSGAGNYIIVKSGSSLTASPVDLASGNLTGVLPASKGGTGISGAGGIANRVLLTTDGSTWQAGLVNLASMVTGVLPISYGGTGASDTNTARANLNAAIAGTCPSGYAVQNATTGSLQCIPVATPSNANVTGAGNPGQIAFWVGSSTLSGDGNLIWDNSAKRLGISVSSPQAKLHVSGDVIIDV
jgi:hypothetical protein